MDIKGTVDEFSVYRSQRPAVTFVVNRKVVSPVMFRNSEKDRAETQEFDGKLHAQVNPEKFVSQERNRGLHLLRYLSEEYGDGLNTWEEDENPRSLISDEYSYNESSDLVQSVNMDTLTYGVAGVGDETYSVKSHVVHGYAYSMDEYSIVDSETRNAVYESGTMRNEDGEQSDSLFSLSPVRPGNNFVSFVTVEAGTPSMILYVLHNILNTSRYGARETRNGKNIQNDILAVIESNHPHSLSSGELVSEYHEEDNTVEESVSEYMESVRDDSWEVHGVEMDDFEPVPDWFRDYREIAGNMSDEEELYDVLHSGTEDAYSTLVMQGD